MSFDAIITLVVILLALILFITELLSYDLVAMIIIAVLIVTGVVTPKEGVAGFGDDATLTVVFMFVLSAAMLKTGALQFLSVRISWLFRSNFYLGLLGLMILVAFISAFINNTPIVAVFMPVLIQLAQSADRSPSKLLMPMTFAVTLGGTITLIGTSSNLVVSGIAVKCGAPPLQLFDQTEFGLVYCLVGMAFLALVGIRLLPDRKTEKDLAEKFGMRDYLTEIELSDNARSVGKRIADSELVRELDMDIREVRRGQERHTLPSGEFVLAAGDVLKIRCDVEKIRKLKDKSRIQVKPPVKIGDADLKSKDTSLVEMVLTTESAHAGQTLKELDFRRAYRAIPLAIRHREAVLHDNFYDVPLQSGDIILAEVSNHFLPELKRMESDRESPFALVSERPLMDFNVRQFVIVASVIFGVIFCAAMNIMPTLPGAIIGVCVLVVSGNMTMREVYQSIGWDTIFLLAGTLALGTAMRNSGLDTLIANGMVTLLQAYGTHVMLAGIYTVTMLLTQIMSNNAAAALLTPIAVAVANRLGVPPLPFLMAVAFAASASFSTPIGYQTNAMIYGAGNYKFTDYMRVGGLLNLILFIFAAWMLPRYFGF